MSSARMESCANPDLIAAYAAGRIAPQEKPAAERLLKHSDECRREFRRLAAGRLPEIPNYTVLEQIGRGGFGVVYKAVHHAKERVEALKLVYREQPLARGFFENEVHLIASLRHPNIATLYDAQLAAEPRYYAMEYVEGERLGDYLRTQRVSLAGRIEIIIAVADALGYAHSQGVVHRDVKPQNILIDAIGQPRIVDFGIAALIETAPQPADERGAVGTIGYVAPEQIAGASPTPQSDIFALGALLFHTITAEPPRLARDPAYREPLLRARGVPQFEDLSAIIARCVADDPRLRYASCGELIADLRRYVAGRAIQARSESSWLRRAARIASLVIRDRPRAAAGGVALAGASLVSALVWGLGARTVVPGIDESRTVIIAFDSSTLERISSGGYDGLVPGLSADDRFTWRSLHGRLMERLARAAPIVVAWDYFFPISKPAHDPDFARGVAALRDAGVPVVVGAASYDLDGQPVVTREIRDAVSAVGTLVAASADYLDREFEVVAAFQRGFEPPIPGLSLAAVAASRFPHCDAAYELDPRELRLTLRYRKRLVESGERRWEPVSDAIPLHQLMVVGAEQRRLLRVMNAADRVATIRVPATSLQFERHSYSAVLDADEAALRRWFEGKAVLVAQTLGTGEDMHTLADGSRIHGCVVHAAAIDTLLRGRLSTRAARGFVASIALCVGAATVVLAMGALRRLRVPLRIGVWTGLACAAVGVWLAAYAAMSITSPTTLPPAIAIAAALTVGGPALLLRATRDHLLRRSPQALVPGDGALELGSTLFAGDDRADRASSA